MSQIKQVDKQQLFFTSSILISPKSVWKNPLVYILRLLAGKFGAICTEFPLATFSAKKLKTFVRKFPAKNTETFPHAKTIGESC